MNYTRWEMSHFHLETDHMEPVLVNRQRCAYCLTDPKVMPLLLDLVCGVTQHRWAYGTRNGKWAWIREDEDHHVFIPVPAPTGPCWYRDMIGNTRIYYPEGVSVRFYNLADGHYRNYRGWPDDVVEILPREVPDHYRNGDLLICQNVEVLATLRAVIST